jgi:hypothetical protein
MFQWLHRLRTERLEKKQARKNQQERLRLLHEAALKRCAAGDHDWEVSSEVQGDSDPNVEGYVVIRRATCRVCHLTETTIEPYERDSCDAED